jgi:hypothetical protein
METVLMTLVIIMHTFVVYIMFYFQQAIEILTGCYILVQVFHNSHLIALYFTLCWAFCCIVGFPRFYTIPKCCSLLLLPSPMKGKHGCSHGFL